MHCLEKYALACNAFIKKPPLEYVFFPLPFSNYITLDLGAEFNHRAYPFFQDVINEILPILHDNNIHLVQLGDAKDEALNGCYYLNKRTQLGHLNYLLKYSLLHVSSQSFTANIANCLGTKQVLLYEEKEAPLCAPMWEDSTIDHILHSSSPRPSLGTPTQEISVSKIFPEKISKKILKNLGLPISSINTQTIYIGSEYNKMGLEVIPNFIAAPETHPNSLVNIRGDISFNEQAIGSWCGQDRQLAIKLPPIINLNFLTQLRPFIQGLSYEVSPNTALDTLKGLRGLGKNLMLYTYEENEERLDELRLKFLDFPIEQVVKTTEKSLDIKGNIDYNELHFKSCKQILSNNQVFQSIPSALQAQSTRDPSLICDSPLFWEDLRFYKIYKKNG